MSGDSPGKTGAGSSSSTQSFDVLFSQNSLLKLLVGIRGSSLVKKKKMELRDHVLEFSQMKEGVKKENTKNAILAVLEEYPDDFSSIIKMIQDTHSTGTMIVERAKDKTEILKTAVIKKTNTGNKMGTTRPTPSFGGSVPIASPIQKNPPTSSTAPVVSKEKETPTVQSVQEQTTPPGAQIISTESKTNPLTRIKEIKKDINARVGNPINLIDQNNDIGRAYMNALLDAMKKSSGGVAGELDRAMQTLEKSYAIVLDMLGGKKPQQKQSTETNHAPKVSPTHTTSPKKRITPIASESPSPKGTVEVEKDVVHTTIIQEHGTVNATIPTKEGDDAAPKNLSSDEVQKTTIMPIETESAQSKKKLVSATSVAIQSKPMPIGVSKESRDAHVETAIPKEIEKVKTDVVEEKKYTSDQKQHTPQAGAPLKKATTLSSLAEQLQKKSDKSLPTSNPMSATGVMDTHAASTPKVVSAGVLEKKVKNVDVHVQAGLDQLLSEWKLFKSSGFFGAGPGGREHPLYVRIHLLPMASVIAGRFEGVTPEIKQSITDYMNGWRYEQGIVHEIGETFEQYLLRVITHILKGQKTKTET